MNEPLSEDISAGDDSHSGHWERPSVFRNRYEKIAVYGVIALFLVWSIWDLRIEPMRLLSGLGSGWELVSRMFPPDFGPRERDLILSGTIESLAMSVVATVIGVIVSVPIAFMAASNMAPRPVYVVGRAIVAISRSLHYLVISIITVKAVGFGALAGVLALVFATPGFFAKLLAEDLEDISTEQLDAIRATGASPLQVIVYGVFPQVLPRFVGLAVYRWDINIRASTIIGIVGAGGIGSTLLSSFQRYDYGFSMAIITVIVVIVIAGEVVSAYVRRRMQ